MESLIKLAGVEFKVFSKRVRITVELVKTLTMIPVAIVPASAAYYVNGEPIYFANGEIACLY